MLDELIATIQALDERVRAHRSYFEMGRPEARTRTSLIDPLLQALEWDVGNPSHVEIEPTVASGRADYALMRRSGEPVVLLEAKKLSDTSTHHGQLASYVVGENLRRSAKIPLCAITNGNRWQVFDVFTQDVVLDASIEHDDPRRCALKLLGLWRRTLLEAIVEPVRVLDTPRAGETASATAPQSPLGRGSVQGTPVGVDGVEGDGWTQLDSDALVPSRALWPIELRLPDGSTSGVDSWISMLVAVARWLFDNGLLRREQLPLTVAGVRFVVSADGRRRDGRQLERPIPIGQTGLVLEGDMTAKQIRRFALELLKHYNQVASDAALKLAAK